MKTSSNLVSAFIKSLFVFFLAFWLVPAWADGMQNVPIDAAHWNVIHRGEWSLTANGLQMNGSGYRVDNWLFSRETFDFTGSEVLIKWQAHGAETFMGTGPHAWGFSPQNPLRYGLNLTTNHSYQGSTYIPDDTWLYSRFVFPNDNSGLVTVSVATGDYDNAGGSVLKTDTISASAGFLGSIVMTLGDNYGATSAYIVLGEVKTSAKVLSASAAVTYNFNDGVIPPSFGLSGLSSISNQTLLVNPDSSSQSVTLNVANYNRISFSFSTDDNSNPHYNGGYNRPMMELDGVNVVTFDTSGSSHWSRVSVPIPSGTQNAQIVSYQGYRLWLDDISLEQFPSLSPCGNGVSLTPNQWQMLATPCPPSGASQVGSAFGSGGTGNLDANNYNTGGNASWVLYTRNVAALGSSGTYVLSTTTDSVAPGTGYWIKSKAAPGGGGKLTVSGTATQPVTGLTGCTSASGCVAVPVNTVAGQNRYNLVGNPFPYNVAWAEVRVLVDGSTVYTPTQAQAAGIISNAIWIWNGTSYDSYSDTAPTQGNLQYSTAFWVNVLPGAVGHTVKLLIPGQASLSLMDMQQTDSVLKTESVLVAKAVDASRHTGRDRRYPDCRDATKPYHPWSLGSGGPCRNDDETLNSTALGVADADRGL